MIKDKFCFVYVTVENFEQAEVIAELAIKDKLVACANIFPESHSMFEWKGEVKLEKETVKNKYSGLFKSVINDNEVYFSKPFFYINESGIAVKKISTESGALSCGISGSGPSIFALSNNSKTSKVILNNICSHLDKVNIDYDSFISKVNPKGIKILD